MHRHYGMPLGYVGHAHDGADGPTHGPHMHKANGLGNVILPGAREAIIADLEDIAEWISEAVEYGEPWNGEQCFADIYTRISEDIQALKEGV